LLASFLQGLSLIFVSLRLEASPQDLGITGIRSVEQAPSAALIKYGTQRRHRIYMRFNDVIRSTKLKHPTNPIYGHNHPTESDEAALYLHHRAGVGLPGVRNYVPAGFGCNLDLGILRHG
jgi:hypothetical protein